MYGTTAPNACLNALAQRASAETLSARLTNKARSCNTALQRTRISTGCSPWRSVRAAELGRYTCGPCFFWPADVPKSLQLWVVSVLSQVLAGDRFCTDPALIPAAIRRLLENCVKQEGLTFARDLQTSSDRRLERFDRLDALAGAAIGLDGLNVVGHRLDLVADEVAGAHGGAVLR